MRSDTVSLDSSLLTDYSQNQKPRPRKIPKGEEHGEFSHKFISWRLLGCSCVPLAPTSVPSTHLKKTVLAIYVQPRSSAWCLVLTRLTLLKHLLPSCLCY